MSPRLLSAVLCVGMVFGGIYAAPVMGQAAAAATPTTADSLGWLDPPPAWSVRAGAVFMQRNTPAHGLIFSEHAPGQPDLGQTVDASDFNFSMTSGFDFELLRHREDWDFQFRLFTLSNSTDPQGFTSVDQGWMNFEQPIGFAGGPTRASVRYVYDFSSEEFNFSYHWNDWFHPLIGLRIVGLNERLDMDLHVLDPATLHDTAHHWDVDMNAYNTLVGLQIGSQFSFFNQGPFRLESTVKAGIYGNAAANSSRLRYHEIGQYYFSDADKGNVAFVGEIGLNGVYQISPHWACSLGYQLLWIDGLALAPQQLSVTNSADNSATVHTASSVFFHGAFATIEYRW
jgi:hypothetical protein